MRNWYASSYRSDNRRERLVPEDFSLEDTVAFIAAVAGL